MNNFTRGGFPATGPGLAPTWPSQNGNTSHSSYRVGATIGVLFLAVAAAVLAFLLVTTVLVALVCYCTRLPVPSFLRAATAGRGTMQGLNEATLASYPKIIYSQAEINSTTCCSICLGDYKDGDVMRQLPECGHRFHVICVDPWLRLNATCPVCRRRSPAPSPMAKTAAPVRPQELDV